MGILSALYNGHPEPYPVSKFRVFIQGFPLGFSKITNIENVYETDALQEGGTNDMVYSLAKPRTGEKTMVFERGIAGRGLVTALLELRFSPGQRLTNDILIMVGGRNGAICSLITLQGCYVKSWKAGDLDASSGGVWIESFEVAYEKLDTNPITSALAGGVMGMMGISAF